jgi:hypothetical protein
MKVNNIEFRWSITNSKYELVQWYTDAPNPHCFVVAFFDEGSEDWTVRTVGSRFFDAGIDAFTLGKHALSFLNAIKYDMENS